MITQARDGGTWRIGTDAEVAWIAGGALPNLMFPADPLLAGSTLWDDDWTCIGGPAGLVEGFARHPGLQARHVALGQDAAPPGHEAR